MKTAKNTQPLCFSAPYREGVIKFGFSFFINRLSIVSYVNNGFNIALFPSFTQKSHLITSIACLILSSIKTFFTRKLKTDIMHEFDSGCKLNADLNGAGHFLVLGFFKSFLRKKIKMKGNK